MHSEIGSIPINPLRFGDGLVLAVALLLAASPAGACPQWIVRASLGSLGLQTGARPAEPVVQLGSPRLCFSILSLVGGCNVIGPFGAGFGATLTEDLRSLGTDDRYDRILNLGPFLTWGVQRGRRPAQPVVSLFATMSSGSDGKGNWPIGSRLGLAAEWCVFQVVTPTVAVEWSEIGPAASATIGVGGWWALGR